MVRCILPPTASCAWPVLAAAPLFSLCCFLGAHCEQWGCSPRVASYDEQGRVRAIPVEEKLMMESALPVWNAGETLSTPLASVIICSLAYLPLTLFICVTLILSLRTHSHTLLITCTRCYDEIKGTQDNDSSYSFSDSLSAHDFRLPLITSAAA